MVTELQTPLSEADILTDLVAPDESDLPPEVAKAILALRFRPPAVARMNELAEKNRQGTLSDDERLHMEKYLRVGNFVNLMQAKARLSLQRQGATT